MSITIELSPEEEARLRLEAERTGTDLATWARQRVLEKKKNSGLLELLKQFEEEDALLSPEEREANTRDWEELKQGLNANRAEEGRPPVFPETKV